MRYAGYEGYDRVRQGMPGSGVWYAGSGEASVISRIMPFVEYFEHKTIIRDRLEQPRRRRGGVAGEGMCTSCFDMCVYMISVWMRSST
jgi:hypothetical protein